LSSSFDAPLRALNRYPEIERRIRWDCRLPVGSREVRDGSAALRGKGSGQPRLC